MSERQQVREHVFHGLTQGMCPVCRDVVPAQVLIRDGAVFLRRQCPEHGWHEALTSSDAEWTLSSQKFNKPGAIPRSFATDTVKGCPDDCGLCPEHQQHTCVGIIEITRRCNLGCAVCFADAGQSGDLSLREVEVILDRFVESEGQPEVLQISGGEPTLHPQLLDILAAAKERDIRQVMLNTNGIRLAEDQQFVRSLAEFNPAIYLQFDGLEQSTHEKLRGRDLTSVKARALDHMADSGLYGVLVATIVKGINDHEIGSILQLAVAHPAVLGLSYQLVTTAGRCVKIDPLDRMTVSEVLHLLEHQTQGSLRVSDFIPVPCPHPECSACTYALVNDGELVPIPRLVDVEDYLDFIVNRTAPNLSDEVQEALEALWSMAATMGTDDTTRHLGCVACGLDSTLPFDTSSLKERFFLVQVHGFMDEHTFDLQRLMKCCIHQLLPDGRAIPFCAYNNLGYRDDAFN